MPQCECATKYYPEVLAPTMDGYKRAKRLFDKGQHPTFIGFDMFRRNAENGGCIIFTFNGVDCSTVIVNAKKNCLLALNVNPDHRGHGLGSSVVNYIKPTWARVIEFRVPWFENLDYVKIGTPKKGRKFITWVMVRKETMALAGRLRSIFEPKNNPR